MRTGIHYIGCLFWQVAELSLSMAMATLSPVENDFADLFASLMYATLMVNIADVHICVGLTQACLNSTTGKIFWLYTT